MKLFAQVAGLALAGSLLLAGCSSTQQAGPAEVSTSSSESFPVTVTHQAGETTIKSKPERIVVLDMGALDTIDAVGVGDKVVGVPTKSVPTWLKDSDGIDYTQTTNVGTLKEPDMEAIAKLNPDLIVLGGRTSSKYEEFSKTFPTIDAGVSWESDTYLQDIANNVRMVGTAVGEQAAGEQAAEKVEEAVKKYTDKAKGQGTAMVLMTSGGEISMHGVESRWAPIWSVFGFDEVKQTEADEGHKGDKLSFETVKTLNPDWLFVVDRDAAVGQVDAGTTASQILDNDLVKSTTASQEGHIVYLSPERWYIVMTGANNIIAMLDEVNAGLEGVKA